MKIKYKAVSELIVNVAYAVKVSEDFSRELLWIFGSLEKMSGYTREELLGIKGWENLIFSEDRKRIKKHLSELNQGNDSVFEYRITCRDGSRKWIKDYARPEIDAAIRQLLTLAEGGAPLRQSCDLREIITGTANFAASGSGMELTCRAG